jgi:hypothetical protein
VAIRTPPGQGAVSLAYIEIGEGTYVAEFGLPPEEVEGGMTLDFGRPIFSHHARIVRQFGGPQLPRETVVRRIWPHASLTPVRRRRLLAFLERTEKGYYFVQWDTRPVGRRACIDAGAVDHYALTGGTRDPEGNLCLPL